MIQTGEKAPAFTLPNHEGEQVSLSDFAGRTVVLYFYPKANTPGCTTQACGIRDRAADYDPAGDVHHRRRRHRDPRDPEGVAEDPRRRGPRRARPARPGRVAPAHRTTS